MGPSPITPSAIILAAGEGRRLGGRAKASLRIDGSSLLQRLGTALRAAGIHELGIVIGPYRDQLLPLTRACGAHVLQHPQAGATLIDSQRLALDHHLAQQGEADLLLVLADLPFLSAAHIQALLEHWREGRYLYLVHPQHDGERKREYVGTDPKKIKAAQDAIARARDYDALAERARQIEATVYDGGQRLASAVDYLSGKRKW